MRRLILLATVFVFAHAGAPPPASPDGPAWDVLEKGARDGSSYKRRDAVMAAASIGNNPRALGLVEGALQDKDAQVRETAAKALGQIKAPQSIPYLKKALSDKPGVAFAAAMSLWAMGDSSGGDLLEDVLTGKRSDGPGLIGGAMRSAKDDLHHPVDLATMGAQKTTGAFFGPASIGVGLARDAFKDKDAPSRAQIATLLGEGHGSGTIRMLEVALHDRSSMVRAAAAKSLGQAGNHEVIPKLVTPMLQDSSHTVRYAAAASVIRLNAQPR
jgi:HEAT repeat protein